MSDILAYTLSLNENLNAKLKAIGFSSDHALDKFSKLQKQSQTLAKVMNDTGRSVYSLQMKLDHLRQERDMIPEKNIRDIRRYNTEIGKLERQITRLQSTGSRKLGNILSGVPGAEMLTNPYVAAGAALFASGKSALSFDEGLAKINTTAQMNNEQLKGLRENLIKIAVDAKANLATVPDAYEKILSQTNDVALSTDILQKALKGAKAGFTDQDVVAAALAQTLSLVGKENTNAQEVIDTLFAAKRVGAGEFRDFANYVPGLVASGQALGKGFKETAGLFAFMTGKGQTAERSAMLIQNAYTALGKSEITKGLDKGGIQVFNADGSMKQLDVIFGQLQKKLTGFGKNDKAKSALLEGMGLRDAQAKQAFMVMASDAGKLTEAINATTNAQGELEKAFAKSDNPMRRLQELWTRVQATGLKLGSLITPILIPAFTALGSIVDIVGKGFDLAGKFSAWWIEKIKGGNPVVIALTALMVGLAGAYAVQAIWSGIVAVKTALWTAAQWALNIALSANPVGLIIAGVIALIAALSYVIYKTEGWGKLWSFLVEFMKSSWAGFKDSFKLVWLEVENYFMSGIDNVKRAWFALQSLWDEDSAKAGMDKIDRQAQARANELVKTRASLQANVLNAGKSWTSATNSLSWNNDKSFSGIADGIKKQLGLTAPSAIAPVGIPGMPGGSSDGSGAGDGSAGKVSDNISAGGARNTSVQITFKNMVENIVFDGNLKEKRADLEREVQSIMARVLGMAQSVG